MRSPYAAEKFENAALSLRLGLLSTYRSQKRSFSNRRNWRTPGLRFRADRKYFDNGKRFITC